MPLTPSVLNMTQSFDLISKCLPLTESDDITFAEPWEARAFVLALQLSKAGYFSWSDWVDFFSNEVKQAAEVEISGGKPPPYFEQWLRALEKIVVAKGVASNDQLFAKQFASRAIAFAPVAKSTGNALGDDR